ncbi:TcpE family conjugal transfer membrane protein [Peptococcaceae bacterium 1198_IL3148]
MSGKILRQANSYKPFFKIKPVIFNLGDIKLPVPVYLEWAVLFFFNLLVCYLVFGLILGSALKAIGLIPWMIVIAFTVAITVLTSKFDAAGKFIPKYIIDFLLFLIRKKKRTFLGPIPKGSKGKFDWKVEVD